MHSAPAKIILLGEHAVVYGQPAIAVPFRTLNARAKATAAPPGSGLTIVAHNIHAALRVHPDDETPDNALTYAAQLVLRQLGVKPPDLTVEVQSSIPIGSGFGSGAAVSAALIRALSTALGVNFEPDTLNALVYEVEKLHHGTPSGIDNTVIVYNMPMYFRRGQPPEPLRVGRTLTFLVADSGISASTRETVGDVRRLHESDPAGIGPVIESVGQTVAAARAAIERASDDAAAELGALMNTNHDLLRRLTVSSEPLDRLVEAAGRAGALGAKLSGGGRGGNVIALVGPEDIPPVSSALRDAGAAQLWTMTLESTV